MEKTQDSSDEDTGNPFATDTNGNGNPFEDEPGSPKVSVPVRALYDYDGQEQDELSFKTGTGASGQAQGEPCWGASPQHKKSVRSFLLSSIVSAEALRSSHHTSQHNWTPCTDVSASVVYRDTGDSFLTARKAARPNAQFA